MENSYGIGVRNRYELFYDDDVDPLDLIKRTEKTKEPKSAEKENKTKGPATAKTKELKATNNKKGEKGIKTEIAPKITDKTNPPATQNKGPRSTEPRVKFSDREERNNRRNRVEGEFRDAPPPRFEGEGRGAMSRGRGRGMGRGRGRGRGGVPEGPDSRGKRQYDRQSGMATTGVKSVDKREGSGSFNWGSDKDQIDEQLNAAPATNSDHDTSTENVEKPPEETPPTEEGGEGAPPKEDDNAKEMTLDEWKAMQINRNKPRFNIRRAGEGENQAQWKKTYILKKKEEEETDDEEEEEEEVHHGRRKQILDIDFQFSDSPARGRGRGRGRGGPGRGRGMDRGGRGRGGGGEDRGRGGGGEDRGDRGERMERGGGRGERGAGPRGPRGRGMSRQEAPKMDDERDFPSLG